MQDAISTWKAGNMRGNGTSPTNHPSAVLLPVRKLPEGQYRTYPFFLWCTSRNPSASPIHHVSPPHCGDTLQPLISRSSDRNQPKSTGMTDLRPRSGPRQPASAPQCFRVPLLQKCGTSVTGLNGYVNGDSPLFSDGGFTDSPLSATTTAGRDLGEIIRQCFYRLVARLLIK